MTGAFRQFVLKVHSRCNLACTYCYLYQGPDSTWREHPARVDRATMERTAERIAEHAGRHALASARVDLHGGEPLLSGPEAVVRYARTVREAVAARAPGCRLRFTVQTNGTLLGRGSLRRLSAAGIRVGLSLDGGTARLDHRRVDHAGRPSFPAAERAARLLAAARRGEEPGIRPGTWAGVLCTIDIDRDPVAVYESLLALDPPSLDLLLPHANWTAPPPGVTDPGPVGRGPRATPYAQWLIPVFDRWWSQGARGQLPTRIRLFEEITALLLGAPSAVESLGHSPPAAVLVETDGTVERVDSLRSAYHGASVTGYDVLRHSFDTVRAAAWPPPPPAAVCRGCPVYRVCGGGNPSHRWARLPGGGTGFAAPSVYCADLEELIRHIATVLAEAARRKDTDPANPRCTLTN